MENRPMKHRGFRQGLYEESSTAKEVVGQIRWDGLRAFKYCKAGAAALSAGYLGLAPQLNAGHLDEAILAAAAIGTTQLSLTVTAAAAIAENALVGGFMQINAGTGAGYQYRVDGNSAITASETSIYVTLEEPGIRVALDTTSKFNLAPNPCYMVVQSATEENAPVGVAMRAVTIAYYYWAQVSGPAFVLMNSTPAIGTMLVPGAVAGSVKAMPTSLDIDMPVVGIKTQAAGVDTEFGAVDLMLL
jgi:hypothetical protein